MCLWSPNERKLWNFQVAYPTIRFKKEMMSSDAYYFHVSLMELDFLGYSL